MSFSTTSTTIRLDGEQIPATLFRLRTLEASDALIDELGEVIRRGEIALLSRLPTRRAIPNLRRPVTSFTNRLALIALVNTLGDCAAVRFTDLGATSTARLAESAHVISSRAVGRFLVASVPAMHEEVQLVEAVRLVKDYRAFFHLWARQSRGLFDDPRYAEIPIRPIWVKGIGERMGELHEMWMLDTDANETNFLWREEDLATTRVDFGESYFVYRAPAPVQCAITFLPLFRSLSPTDYLWFKQGYVEWRGAQGQRVFDVIEHSDTTGWAEALRNKDYTVAATRVRAQLDQDADMDELWRVDLWNSLGVFLSRGGAHRDADEAFHTAEGLARNHRGKLPGVLFNKSQAQLRAGSVNEALTGFERVRELETDTNLAVAAAEMIEQCREPRRPETSNGDAGDGPVATPA